MPRARTKRGNEAIVVHARALPYRRLLLQLGESGAWWGQCQGDVGLVWPASGRASGESAPPVGPHKWRCSGMASLITQISPGGATGTGRTPSTRHASRWIAVPGARRGDRTRPGVGGPSRGQAHREPGGCTMCWRAANPPPTGGGTGSGFVPRWRRTSACVLAVRGLKWRMPHPGKRTTRRHPADDGRDCSLPAIAARSRLAAAPACATNTTCLAGPSYRAIFGIS